MFFHFLFLADQTNLNRPAVLNESSCFSRSHEDDSHGLFGFFDSEHREAPRLKLEGPVAQTIVCKTTQESHI